MLVPLIGGSQPLSRFQRALAYCEVAQMIPVSIMVRGTHAHSPLQDGVAPDAYIFRILLSKLQHSPAIGCPGSCCSEK